jgi:hypothetical protein
MKIEDRRIRNLAAVKRCMGRDSDAILAEINELLKLDLTFHVDYKLKKLRKQHENALIRAERYRKRTFVLSKKNRLLVLSHYGGDPPMCACCGERRFEFLAIDHIGGGGNKHRKKVGAESNLAYWLTRNGLPNGFRVLCHNCNMAIGFYGYCPHNATSIHKDSAEITTPDFVEK